MSFTGRYRKAQEKNLHPMVYGTLHKKLKEPSDFDRLRTMQYVTITVTVRSKEKRREKGLKFDKRGNTMEIRARDINRELLLEFSGEMDHHGARNALKEVEMAIDAALPQTLILDFSGVTFMDSSGIALLIRSQQRMQLLEGSIIVRNVPRQAKRVLDAAGIGRLISIQ